MNKDMLIGAAIATVAVTVGNYIGGKLAKRHSAKEDAKLFAWLDSQLAAKRAAAK